MKRELAPNGGISFLLLAGLSFATAVSVANCYYNQPLLETIAQSLGVSRLCASAIAALTQAGYVAGLLFIIPLGDMFSRRKIILTNSLVAAAALICIGISTNVYSAWIASLIAGAASVMPQFFIPLVALDSTPEYKVRNVGIVQASLLVGILASRVFSGLLADAFGWRSVYFAAAAMMIICFAMMFKILPDQQAVAAKSKYADMLKSLWTLLKKYPYLRFASLRASLAYGSFFALWSTLSFKMKQPPFFAGDDIIGALGLCGLAGAATVVFISSYIYKYGAKIFSAIGAVGIILSWLAALIGHDNYVWIIFAILVLDAGMQCIHLSNQTSVVALDSAAINRINTVYMSVYFVGGALGTFVGGLCWQHWGWTGVAASGIIFASASLIVNALAPLEKRKA